MKKDNNNSNSKSVPHPNTGFIDNLVSRTIGSNFSESSSESVPSSTTATSKKFYDTTIRPALIPDMIPNILVTYSDEDKKEERLNLDMQDLKQEPIAITSFAASKSDHSKILTSAAHLQAQSLSTITPSVISGKTDNSKNLVHPANANHYQVDLSDDKGHNDTHQTPVLTSKHNSENNKNIRLSADRFNSSVSPYTRVPSNSITPTTSSTNVTIHIGRIEVQGRIAKLPLSNISYPQKILCSHHKRFQYTVSISERLSKK